MRMRFTDYFRLAFRNILHQRSRSVLAIMAIVIGTTSVTILLALVIGAKNFYYDQFKATGQLQQLVVSSQKGLDFEQAQQSNSCDGCVELTDKLAGEIASYDHVKGLSRTAAINVFSSAGLNGKKQNTTTVQGYEPNGVVSHIFLAGRDFNSSDGTGKVIVGQDFADKWGYKDNYKGLIGKQITLTTDSNFTGQGAKLADPLAQFKQCEKGCDNDKLPAQQPSTLKATVVGVESDHASSMFVPLKWAQGLLKNRHYEIATQDQATYTQAYNNWVAQGRKGPEPTPKFTIVSDNQIAENGYTAFIVKVDNSANAESVAQQIQKLGVGTAIAQNYINSQLQIFNIISYILAAIGIITLVVAAIGIVNTMVMATLERTREIGVMRAVGAKRSVVSRLFTLEASLLGFLGGTFGIIIGFGLVELANFFINGQLADNAVASRNIISLPIWLIFAVIIVTTIIGMLAGLYPAHRAASLDPVEALRHE